MPSNEEKRQYLLDRRYQRARENDQAHGCAMLIVGGLVAFALLFAGGELALKKIGLVDTSYDRVVKACNRVGGKAEVYKLFGNERGGFCYVEYPTGRFQVPLDSSTGARDGRTVDRQRERCQEDRAKEAKAVYHADTGICEWEFSSQKEER